MTGFRCASIRMQKATSDAAAFWIGHHRTLAAMTVLVLGWAAYGFAVSFTREWLLISNTVGTLVVFLILLLLQHARNRHTLAMQAKLDELIHSSEAQNHWIGVERHPAELVEEMRLRHHATR